MVTDQVLMQQRFTGENRVDDYDIAVLRISDEMDERFDQGYKSSITFKKKRYETCTPCSSLIVFIKNRILYKIKASLETHF
jgi:hypothetical protein